MENDFSSIERSAIYRVIQARRDIRHFRSDDISTEILERILAAAHAAPSVGFMQPWNFIVIRSLDIRQQIKKSFDSVNTIEIAEFVPENKKNLYSELKLEGILEAPLNLAVTCDLHRGEPFVLGKRPMPETAIYSVCLAIQNLWLAARVEGIGIGWVSILDKKIVEDLLRLPSNVQLVAYLCMGYPTEFRSQPLLQEVGWKNRESLDSLIFNEQWGMPWKK